MRIRFFPLIAILSVAAVSCSPAVEPLEDVIERGLATARVQAARMAEELLPQEGVFPRSYENGQLITADYHWWTAGFFPGVLWQLYDDSGEERFLEYARRFTERARPVADMTDTHDLGFMLHCSFGKGYVLTGNEDYLDVLKRGSVNLAGRWNPSLGVIKSWESSPRWKYPVIIDNMMNLEMLCFVSRETGDRGFYDMAVRHADVTLENHFREDGSTWHVVSYDPETLGVQCKNTAQGYSDDSAWARGQSWGLYGYTMMYRETGDEKYLAQARKIARFLIGHPHMPEDLVPYWDYDAPEIPDAVRDASSAAIMASALIELAQLDPSEDAKLWLETAEKQIRSLTSDQYLAREGTNGGFILLHSTGNLPGRSEIDVPLTYADYYYLEALLRMKDYLHCRPRMAEGVMDTADTLSLGLPRYANLQRNIVFRSEGYVNNVVLTHFRGRYYCMWQQSEKDEDTPDTGILYSVSSDGKDWEIPSVLVPPAEEFFASPGGWIPCGDTLTALVNYIYAPDRSQGGKAFFVSSADGSSWSAPRPVRMSDGTPVDGIFEQDPLALSGGRMVGAVHFRPGNTLCPVYTEDPSGVRGWRKAVFPEGEGLPLEPSQYVARDGKLVMLMRDQQSSFVKLFSISADGGKTWSAPRKTNIPDSRSKQCAGTLPDGTAFWVGNPTGSKSRRALAIGFSGDGYLFDRAYLLSGPQDLSARRKEGRYKTLGYNYPKACVVGDTLWIALSVNKEDVAVYSVKMPIFETQ